MSDSSICRIDISFFFLFFVFSFFWHQCPCLVFLPCMCFIFSSRSETASSSLVTFLSGYWIDFLLGEFCAGKRSCLKNQQWTAHEEHLKLSSGLWIHMHPNTHRYTSKIMCTYIHTYSNTTHMQFTHKGDIIKFEANKANSSVFKLLDIIIVSKKIQVGKPNTECNTEDVSVCLH